MAKLCTVCGKAAVGFNKFAHPVGDTVLCDKCYDKLPSLKLTKAFSYKSLEEIDADYGKVKEELKSAELTPEANEDIIEWFEQLRKKFVKAEEVEEERERTKDFYNDVRLGKFEDEISNFITTSGFNFEGFNIIEYHGVVVGETVIGTGFLSDFTASFADAFGTESARYGQKLESAREASMKKAMVKSIYLGGNALIGVDIDYITFTADKIGVVYSGTSVKIEKTKTES